MTRVFSPRPTLVAALARSAIATIQFVIMPIVIMVIGVSRPEPGGRRSHFPVV
jgi:hypothetical protein